MICSLFKKDFISRKRGKEIRMERKRERESQRESIRGIVVFAITPNTAAVLKPLNKNLSQRLPWCQGSNFEIFLN